jgi:hypothetical protein
MEAKAAQFARIVTVEFVVKTHQRLNAVAPLYSPEHCVAQFAYGNHKR